MTALSLMAVRNNAVRYRAAADILLFALIVVAAVAEAPSADPNATSEEDRWVHASRALPFHLFVKSTLHVNSKFLVVDQAPDVKYHNGPILTGDRRSTLKVHVVFYGSWSRAQKAIIQSFLSSFSAPKAARNFPTVQGWWAITRGFKNTRKVSVAPYVVLGSQVHDWKYSLGTGFDVPPLKSPNGDAGVDGMIINIGAMIAGAATNPYGRGYFQGDPADPLEVAGVCAGIYGANSFPGMPGDLLKDSRGASFNVYGANRRKFLVPWMYSPRTKQCAGQA
uniref:Neprosin domain-containing protein n=1 Tax=Physcomitrium patens TaxID=3218 RepID=A0A7I4CBM7_PHYPA